jgi:DNA invertase Pin-like site-specific DNA recombinase
MTKKKVEKIESSDPENNCQTVLYARFSAEEQKQDGHSTQKQLDLLRNIAHSPGIEVTKEIVESGTSQANEG